MELYELNLHDAIDGLKDKKFSASELFDSCKARIDALEPNIHAFITRTDSEFQATQNPSGVLAGIPTVLKDNLCTLGIRTTAASKILGNWRPPYDATAWKHLHDAGAVLMGKVNMDEFAMGNTCGNSAFGPTHNPRQCCSGQCRIRTLLTRQRHRRLNPSASELLRSIRLQAHLRHGQQVRTDLLRLISRPDRPLCPDS